MMKNLLFVYICLFGLALPLSAQKLDAQDILDRTATAFRQTGGIQADFTVQTYAKGVLQGSSVGTIRLKGEKFLLVVNRQQSIRIDTLQLFRSRFGNVHFVTVSEIAPLLLFM